MKLKFALTLCAAAAVLGLSSTQSFAKGMIVPAYIPLTDTTDWSTLAAEATYATASTNPVYRDYWVTVNSSNNGPFTSSSDWTTAAGLWNPIRANGGKIFGYVHTNANNGTNDAIFRSLSSVEADITSWVNGYSNLDGIWLDEFYPRYEIAPDTGTTATFPNGTSLAPYDTTYYSLPGYGFTFTQVNPNGGYYSQLIGWIRSTYPKLRIIGNAGGWLWSNQLNYINLPDVTCTFEQSYNYAYVGPSNTYNWAGLNQETGISTYESQLALIHGNSSDLNGAIDQAISHGYPYFYTTNGIYGNNVWGSIPPYFDSEVSYIAAHS